MDRKTRPQSLIDVMDYDVISVLSKESLGIMKLSEKINVAHKNLLGHLNKLQKMGIIRRDESPKGRRVNLFVTKKAKMIKQMFRIDVVNKNFTIV